MDQHGSFIARLLDTGLRGFAAETAVRQRQCLQEQGFDLPPGVLDSLIADTEARVLVLGESLATARPALFLEHLEWGRSSYLARGVSEQGLALNLLCLRDVLLRNLPPDAHSAVQSLLDAAGRSFELPPRPIGDCLETDSPQGRRVQEALLAILEARREDALRLLLAPLDEGVSVLEVETGILGPLQTAVGALWQRGELHVHEEHYATRIVEEALVLLRSRMVRGPGLGKSVLLCSVAGNLHDVGACIVADHFEAGGWRPLRLGANVPGEDLGRAVFDFHADLLAVSVTLSSQVRRTAALLSDVRAFCDGEAPPILVGGPPFNLVPDLWRVVGADGFAESAPGAVREGKRLLGLSA
ncbi:MAG: cobalamin-dependent protein [Planctomycetes bacterium]|nr:cobalamin-dependent protein [Planctomycetota bacterium]